MNQSSGAKLPKTPNMFSVVFGTENLILSPNLNPNQKLPETRLVLFSVFSITKSVSQSIEKIFIAPLTQF